MMNKPFHVFAGLLAHPLALGGMADAALRVYALVDVAKRPEAEIHGSKAMWVPALAVVSSMGLLPCAYLKYGRRTP